MFRGVVLSVGTEVLDGAKRDASANASSGAVSRSKIGTTGCINNESRSPVI